MNPVYYGVSKNRRCCTTSWRFPEWILALSLTVKWKRKDQKLMSSFLKIQNKYPFQRLDLHNLKPYFRESLKSIRNAKAAFKKKTLFTNKLDLHLKKDLLICYIWCIALNGAKILIYQNVDQKYLESFKMWHWRRMKLRFKDLVRNEEVVKRAKGERNIL